MRKAFIKFIKGLTIFSVIIIVLSFTLTRLLPGKYVTPTLPFVLIFFFLITVAAYYFLLKTKDKKFSTFVNVFMMTIFLRLMLYLGVIVFYSFIINRKDAVAFISWFFIYYLLYTIFETVYILHETQNARHKTNVI